MPGREWVLRAVDRSTQTSLSRTLGISPVLAHLLLNRGLSNPEQARVFLQGNLQDLQDSFGLPGMEQAVSTLATAVAGGEKVLVYGDYDVDGLTSTALLCSFLTAQGIENGYFIPDRLAEGYGLHREALSQAIAAGYRVVVTVDCGLAAGEEIAWARNQGLQVVVSDHHHPPPDLPPADAVVTPPQGHNLAGVGVTFHLVRALSRRLGEAVDIASYLDLVALGTVADVVPLVGDNRIFVREGLKQLAAGGRPGLDALAEVSRVAGRELDARLLAFSLIPRLNAAGRLGDALPALKLLLTTSIQEAWELARALDGFNRERQVIEGQILAQAQELIARDVDLTRERVIVLASPLWHGGIVGIVAGRLAGEYRRPVVLLAVEGDEARGSGRGVPGVSLYDLLAACGDLLSRFGGHELAVGLALPVSNLAALRRRLVDLAADRWVELPEPPLNLEAAVGLDQVDEELLAVTKQLEPYGEGNPVPVFAVWGARVIQAREVGRDGEHLQLMVEAGGARKAAVGFGMGNRMAELALDPGSGEAGQLVDLAFTPFLDDFNGCRRVELRLAGMRPAMGLNSGPAALVAAAWSESCSCFNPAEFFAFWKGLSKRLRADRKNCIVVVPTAGLAARFKLWLRELGLAAVRVGNTLRRQQVEALVERWRGYRGVTLVLTAGFFGQHGALLAPGATVVWFCSSPSETIPPLPPGLPPPLRLGLQGQARPVGRSGVGKAATSGGAVDYRLAFDGLAGLIKEGRQLLIYVRKTEQAEELQKRLLAALPGLKDRLGLYHQDLEAPAKTTAARAWEGGRWQVMVSTPAAAALNNTAGAKEVIFCYPPFSRLEYHFLRLGAVAAYCCWSQTEEALNERYLSLLWPPASLLELVCRPGSEERLTCYPQQAVQMALSVLEELGWPPRPDDPARLPLHASWRYREAKDARVAWEELRDYANNLPFRR